MRLKNLIVMATVAFFATSCGESSTKETTGKDTITTTDISIPVSENPVNTNVNTNIVVPEPVKTSFQTKYPNVSNVTWNRYEPVSTFDWEWSGWPMMDTSDYMVKFNMDGNEYWSWYDNDNTWVATVSPVKDFAGLPAAVNKTIQTEFDGYTIVSVDMENDKNRTAYEVELTKGEAEMKALIAENGTILKKKGGMPGEKMKEKNM